MFKEIILTINVDQGFKIRNVSSTTVVRPSLKTLLITIMNKVRKFLCLMFFVDCFIYC